MFHKVSESDFIRGEHAVLRFWREQAVFEKLRRKNAGGPKWSFLDGPITANNPMGVHHAWGRTYKDAFQRYFAMTGHDQRYQNGFDCQGLWVEVEVEKELKLGTKTAINEFGIDRFVNECKKRVLRFAARQTEQSIRLGYWMDWDDPDTLRLLAERIGTDEDVTITTPSGKTETGKAHELVAKLGNPEWGGSYFTFSTENNATIWTFLKKCFQRGKVYRGYDVMPWSGRAGSAYSQMEVADGRRLTVHRSCFVRLPVVSKGDDKVARRQGDKVTEESVSPLTTHHSPLTNEYLLVWTTTPWTLTSNVACAVNSEEIYVRLQTKRDDEIYYLLKENLDCKRQEQQFKEGFGSDGKWPKDVPKLKTIAQIFKEQGGYEVLGTLKGAEMVGWRYEGPFDELDRQTNRLFAADDQGYVDSTVATYPDVSWAEIEWSVNDQDSDGFLKKLKNRLSWFAVFLDQSWGDLLPYKGTRFQDETSPIAAYGSYSRNLGLSTTTSSDWIQLSELEAAIQASSEESLFSTLDKWCAGHPDSKLSQSWNTVSRANSDRTTAIRRTLEVLLESLADSIRSEFAQYRKLSPVQSHRVIDGGRDSKGNPNVVAGEGTGIVHIAPGCGDVDHKLGEEFGLPSIAPLQEDGTFGDGFGPFTGKEAIDPDTAQLVFNTLKENEKLVYVEQYPHIYPHCWRTGDELVFRLVDEWFINMDWRDEIKEVVKAIRWLPDSIQGQEREIEWLTNMRDWMISKKRFWGLALPIWVNPDDPSDFEVIGSLSELKARAVEGWDDFAGHTPHRPWIDGVKIKSEKTGATLSRIVDVGNPWLDAGITPFSTMHYNTNRDEWSKWFPADFVTECFPGQFRNWFYSLLALSTMMRYDETDDLRQKRPFKNLLGHRLVMDERGNAMHKSDGTAIWFEEAAEQLGVDTMRWMYMAQNPAVDLRFGTRHPDQPVPLDTPEGHITETTEGLPTCLVTSKPSDEIRRQILIPLWNSYAFFVNYAVADEFDPAAEPVPVAERPEIDRWILSNLQALIGECRRSFEAFDAASACNAAARFIDDLSNWYIRRNRRRFWRSKDAGDRDKLAAYQTLYEVLLTLTRLLAPCIPFLCERMYQNLAHGCDPATDDEPRTTESVRLSTRNSQQSTPPESVHLCPYPSADESVLDPELNARMAAAQLVVRIGHMLRDRVNIRVRQPLAEARYVCASESQRDAIARLADLIKEELNVKELVPVSSLDDIISYSYLPNRATLGRKFGKLLPAIESAIASLSPTNKQAIRNFQTVTIEVDGNVVVLEPGDVGTPSHQSAGWSVDEAGGVQLGLSVSPTPALRREGMGRDFVRQVQQLRKEAKLDILDRIRIFYRADDPDFDQMIKKWSQYICSETLADSLESAEPSPVAREVRVGDISCTIWIERA